MFIIKTNALVPLLMLLLPVSLALGHLAEEDLVTVKFTVTVPADTDPKNVVYLAGNLPEVGGWQADGVAMKRTDSGEHVIELKLPRGEVLEYKVTRGSWETVEKGPKGEEIDNRTLRLDGDSNERISVASWRADVPGEPRQSTISGDVRVHDSFRSKLLSNHRRLLVYVPPDYDKNQDQRYPVLYMHDGQNLFDDATSFAGEWRADETADELIRAGKIPPIIIVGIENTPQRVTEYTTGVGGRGHDYARFIVEEVVPFIEATYRTRKGREHTGVAGSSLGGLISLYMVQQHPDVFGRCGAISPSLWWGNEQLLQQAQTDASWARNGRIWFDMGSAESDDVEKTRQGIADCQTLAQALDQAGLVRDRDYVWRTYEGAKHNEQAWAERFDEILIFLFADAANR